MGDAMETDDWRRAEALNAARAMVGKIVAGASEGADPELTKALVHAKLILPNPRDTVALAAFAGAWGYGRVRRNVAEEIEREVVAEYFGS